MPVILQIFIKNVPTNNAIFCSQRLYTNPSVHCTLLVMVTGRESGLWKSCISNPKVLSETLMDPA